MDAARSSETLVSYITTCSHRIHFKAKTCFILKYCKKGVFGLQSSNLGTLLTEWVVDGLLLTVSRVYN
jgi:hypothetical protein